MIDVNNESGVTLDEKRLIRLSAFVLHELRIHPQTDVSILIVDATTMANYNEKFMERKGPTDVLSFPMDELRVPTPGQSPPLGLLGDVVLCPSEIARRAPRNRRSADDETAYLLIHGLLHLLGYDHDDAQSERVMFSLQDRLFADWLRS